MGYMEIGCGGFCDVECEDGIGDDCPQINSSNPTAAPSMKPTYPSVNPTDSPTIVPSDHPSATPSETPSNPPTYVVTGTTSGTDGDNGNTQDVDTSGCISQRVWLQMLAIGMLLCC